VESSGTFYILWDTTGTRTERNIANNQRSVHTLSKHALSRDCRHIERINVGVGVRAEKSDDISYLRLKVRVMHDKLCDLQPCITDD
jgi:hypothetical protein